MATKKKATSPKLTRKMADKIDIKSVDELTPYARNSRTHSAEQIKEIAASIERFGFTNPILYADGEIIAGHGRLAAAKLLNWTEVPAIDLSHLDAAERRAYVIADNRLAEKAGWDDQMLAEELSELKAEGLDIAITGFNEADLDKLLDSLDPDAGTEEPGEGGIGVGADDDLVAKWNVERGQVWEIGPHRLAIGDSTDAATVEKLMRGAQAALVFTDPPYGVSYEAPSGEHEVIRGDKLRDDDLLEKLLIPSLALAVAHARDEAGFYIWHAMATRADFDEAAKRVGLVELETIIWSKPSASLGMMDYRRDYEPCLYCAKDGFNPKFYGDRKNVTTWRVAHADPEGGVGAALGKQGILLLAGGGRQIYLAPDVPTARKKLRKIRMGDAEGVTVSTGGADSAIWEVSRTTGYQHPTEKPTALAARAIENSSQVGEIVLDLFLGSGSTMAAAEEHGRVCYGVELDLQHAAGILERMEKAGLRPHLTTK